MKKFFKRFLACILALCLVLAGVNVWSNHKGQSKSDLKFVFVHGLSGWGHYDTVNNFMPYL